MDQVPDTGVLSWLNGLAGVAALLNGLLLWPVVRSLKQVTHAHGTRLTRLEHRGRKRKRRFA